MAKEYIYTNTKSRKVLFRTIEPNYVSKESIDLKMKEKTGQDPRLDRHTIECTIRVVADPKLPATKTVK
ncbi:MAG: hypothetical protein KGI25_09755 [Thaumarchaeota archaeon]|nr:hypothetical protein [Nitrososphaerota archaeon]